MTIRDILKAITEDKKVNITSTPIYATGEIMTGREALDVYYFDSPKRFYGRYDNADHALMEAAEDVLDQPIYMFSDYDEFFMLDYKVVCE